MTMVVEEEEEVGRVYVRARANEKHKTFRVRGFFLSISTSGPTPLL